MWLTSSSIGRKFVMALTGICLVLFVTFHVLMNAVALIWPTAYNQVCEFLGANWYALVASAGLALLFVIHIIYACWLTLQNRRARGASRYAVTSRPPQVEWASKNMLVLGIVVVAFLVVHLIQFWAKMQLQELLPHSLATLPTYEGAAQVPSFGTLFLQEAFKCYWTPIIYVIGFVALWFHMTHGFWSMLHSVGWDNNLWLGRLRRIACWWTTIVVALFVAQAALFTYRAHQNYYLTDPALQEQYGEYWEAKSQALIVEFQTKFQTYYEKVDQNNPMAAQDAETQFISDNAQYFAEQAGAIVAATKVQCPSFKGQFVSQMPQFKEFLDSRIEDAKTE